MATRPTPGQAADTTELVALLDEIAVPRANRQGRHRKRPDHLLADNAYVSRANRRALRARGIPHTIPERDDVIASRARKGSRGGRPPNFNASKYRDRNSVERGFGRRKSYRAVATRYDKLASRYLATHTVASIMDWLRARPDRKPSKIH
jgi:transposase